MRPGLYFCQTPGKNYGLHLINETKEKYWALKKAVNRKNFEGLNPFFQSDSDPFHTIWQQEILVEEGKDFNHDYLFIEFWSNDFDLMLKKSQAFADSIGAELLVEDF